jgi:CheY-like chemotaxis protein/HPt (histidine-containing phosphotransfer) domain-containing protein
VGNAIKFTQSGEVALRVTLEKDEGTVAAEPSVLLRFSVRDTGIGIPKDKLDILFDKFTQADASTTRKYGGTGLGLAISKQLAELMGGEVGVESEEGRGSEFSFTARLKKQTRGMSAETPSPADLSNVRVLIVDDNATSREILSTLMVSWGMRPAETSDGAAALQALRQAQADKDPFVIAVLDMQMPGMDGETLGLAIKADERLAGTRMVMLTSLGMPGDACRLQEIGFDAFLTKPTRHLELKSVLSLAIGGRGTIQTQPQPDAKSAQGCNLSGLFAGGKARILLAEDNISNQLVALGILKKLGLRADAVANGDEAVKALCTLPYDVVLMDVQMPVMDGLEATRQIRSKDSTVRNHDIPVIAMTARAMQGDREKCLAAGMNDYVSKPVTPQSLSKTLKKWLPQETEEYGKQADIRTQERTDGAQTVEPPVWNYVEMMERMMGDEDLAKTILAGFLEDVGQRIQDLKACLAAGDVQGFAHQAHTIKGASAVVGGEALYAVVFGMEKAAKDGNLADSAVNMTVLDAQFERLKTAIETDRLTGGGHAHSNR